jgi:DNA-binding response OmpR family regulator
VDSQPGEGTVFTIYLPRASGFPEARAVPPPPPPRAAEGETILLVEDEQAVRRLVRDMLVRHGYRVVEAENGRQALQLFQAHQHEIALLLTDVVMPEMNGRDLARHLRACRPDLKVLYMSGYTGDAMSESAGIEPGAVFIQKPFTPRTLLRRVREALADTKKNA